MAGSGGVENARYKGMLQSLQQQDPEIDHVVAYSKFVVAYLLHQDGPNPGWRKANIEGPVYLVRRRVGAGGSRYQLLVKNQFSTNDLLDAVHPDWELDCQTNYVFYKIEDPSQRIRGLWFHDDSERQKIEASLERVLEEIRRAPPGGGVPGPPGAPFGSAPLGSAPLGCGGAHPLGGGCGGGGGGGGGAPLGGCGAPHQAPPFGAAAPPGAAAAAGPAGPAQFGGGRAPMPGDGSADALYAQFGLVRPGGDQFGPPGGAQGGWNAAPGQGPSHGSVIVTEASLRTTMRSLADDDFFLNAITQKLKEQAL